MRSSRRLIALLLCLVFLLTGCSVPPDAPEQQDPPELPDVSEPQQPENEMPQQPEDTEQETPPEVPLPEIPEKSAILEQRQPMDDAGTLWYIPNREIESTLMGQVFMTENGLLYARSMAGPDGKPAYALSVISLETGEVEHSLSFSGLELPDIQLCSAGIAVTDWMDGRIWMIDEQLRSIKEYDSDGVSCAVFVDPDFTRAFTFPTDGGVRMTDMATGEVTVLLENAVGLYGSVMCGDTVSVTYTDKNTQLSGNAVVDLAAGEAQTIPFEGAFHSVARSGDIWLAGVYGQENTYWIGRDQRPNAFVLSERATQVKLLSDGSGILTTTYTADGMILRLYRMDGSFVSSCTLPAETGLNYEPVWSEADGGYYFTVIQAPGKDVLLFWDLSAPVSGMDLTLRSQFEPESEGSVVSAALYERAESFYDRFGVRVKIAEQAETEYQQYVAAAESDETYISRAMDDLEAVLSTYPDGFFRQLFYGTVREITFHLTGALTKTTGDADNGFTTFAAFVETNEGGATVTVDITSPGSLAETMHHEIFHLIDNKMTFDAGIRDDALYSEEGWSALNPEGFAYAESYHDLPMEFYQSEYEAWFAELYSRTYAREDRATIFEAAMAGREWIFGNAPGRLAKLEYLCRCIRDCFDTTGWDAITAWEAACLRTGGSLS